MFMLGEMAARNPDSGSFSTYASDYLGEWAGYTVGWLYWFKWMITITLEALLLGAIIHDFLPPVSLGVATFAIILFVNSMNLYSVKVFGELEYWLSFIKVAAIIIFLILGVSILLGFQSTIPAPGLTNLTLPGGFIPNGISPVLAGVVVAIFAFDGSEIAAIAAGESENPKKDVVNAIRSVMLRVLIFYFGSVSIIILCLPWTDTAALQSPYVALFSLAGFPGAATAMKIVLFVSFLSVMNSGVYTASRMLFSLSQRGFAPTLFAKTSPRGIPLNALMLSMVICLVVLLAYFLSGGDFFLILAESSGSLIIVVWLFIVVAHFVMRRKSGNVHDDNQFKAWFYPYSNWLTIITLITVLVSEVLNPDSRFQFWFTVVVVIMAVGSYFISPIGKRITKR
jgi:GABA permease